MKWVTGVGIEDFVLWLDDGGQASQHIPLLLLARSSRLDQHILIFRDSMREKD
jgi:hypothetical protein